MAKDSKTTKIALEGRAGQGIKLLGYVLAHILADGGYQVALTSEYDAFARAGKSSSFVVFSKEPIENPIVEKPDYEYDLNNEDLQNELLSKNPDQKALNMTLLGKILKELGIKWSEIEIRKYLPKKRLQENLSAIKRGTA